MSNATSFLTHTGAAPRWFYDGSSGLYGGASRVSWYGEVADNEKDGIATYTDMGSGAFNYAYIRLMQVIPGSTGVARDMAPTSFFTTDSNCYDGTWSSVVDGTWNTNMFLGGPGHNANCISD